MARGWRLNKSCAPKQEEQKEMLAEGRLCAGKQLTHNLNVVFSGI